MVVQREVTRANVGRPLPSFWTIRLFPRRSFKRPFWGVPDAWPTFYGSRCLLLLPILLCGCITGADECLEERTVGRAGADSVAAGYCDYCGFAAGSTPTRLRAGVFANIALIINLFLVMGVLSALSHTTLPGIASIVYFGMAVDANVLISSVSKKSPPVKLVLD